MATNGANGGGSTRRHRVSNYLRGGENSLVAKPRNPGEDLVTSGQWPREQLVEMDSDFVTAMERAFRSRRESPASASPCERPRAGDSAPAS
jgi:hypothetical protein